MPTATFRRYQYRRYLPHYQKDDRPLFVTFRTRKPQKLSPEARTVVLQHCLHDNTVTITLHAAVIMPDHAHLLFTARPDAERWTFALPEILRAIKGTSARSINILLGRRGSVWQDESFDHVLRGNESLLETVEYIRQNPLRKGLVSKPEDYPWLWIFPALSGLCGAGTPAREP
ncbi:MAG TPA: transposase [Candidatus Sulfotelmatobacter sp.]|nr:transposase [Candidatus Sulfotelmatobacter sp.]